MSDQIPRPEVDYLPLGTILPFLSAKEVHADFVILNGQTITIEENEPLVTKMHSRWKDLDLDDPANSWAHIFWLRNGGGVYADRVIMPVFNHRAVVEFAFGATFMSDDARPVLAIRFRRHVISTDGTSQVDTSDSNT